MNSVFPDDPELEDSTQMSLGYTPQTVAIVRALPGLGDLLCIVPALRTLRQALPAAKITLIGLPCAVDFAQRFNQYLDDYLEFPGFPGIPEVAVVPHRTIAFLTAVQRRFDLVLQLHGSGLHINSFAMLLGAKETAGFFPAAHVCPDVNRFLPYPEQEPEIWRSLRLLEFLGLPLQGEALEFSIGRSDWQAGAALAAAYRLRRYVCLHAGASISSKRWSPRHFAAVADALAERGYQIVLTGSAAEVSLTEEVAQFMQAAPIDLAGKTSLGGLAALLKQAALVICNDTGVSHLADALQVSSVVVFSSSDPQRWAPLDRQKHRVLGGDRLDSTPDPAAVLQAVVALLQPEVACAN